MKTKSSQIRIGLLYPIDFGHADKRHPTLEILVYQLGLAIFYHFVYRLALAYNANAYYHSYIDDSVIIIDLTISAENKELVIKEANKIVKNLDISHLQIEDTKQRLIGQYIINNENNSDQVRLVAEEYYRQKKIFSLPQHLKKIKSTTDKAVDKIYQQYLKNITPKTIFVNI
jgi:predicted Zn-dependent peptidase